MRRRAAIIVIIWAFLLKDCSREQGAVEPAVPVIPVAEPTIAELVIANCYSVQSAAVEFALENNSEYPEDISEVSAAGHTLVDLLPDSAYLDNPFTGGKTEPVDYTAWRQGEIAYRPICTNDAALGRSFASGYVITGFADSSRCFTLSNLPPSYYEKDERTIENCCAVMRAAEAFAAENHGFYPHNVGAERTPLGNTLIDLLPDGILLQNPYHLCRTEPIDGAAAQQGQTGYVVCTGGEQLPTGYCITGSGDTNGCTIQMYRQCE